MRGVVVPSDGSSTGGGAGDADLGSYGNRPAVLVAPDASNTGPRYSITQVFSSGNEAISAAQANGGLLERAQINGTVQLRDNDPNHAGLVFSDCVIDGGAASYAVNGFAFGGSPGAPAEFRWCEIRNANSATALTFDTRLLRCNIHHGVDGVKTFDNSEVYACYIHDLKKFAGSHVDGIQVVSGTNIIVHWSTIEAWVAEDATQDPGSVASGGLQSGSFNGDVYMELYDNWVDGGGYTLRGAGGSEEVTQIFRRNKHGRGISPYTGELTNGWFGPISGMNELDDTSRLVSDYDDSNVWLDDGMPVNGG